MEYIQKSHQKNKPRFFFYLKVCGSNRTYFSFLVFLPSVSIFCLLNFYVFFFFSTLLTDLQDLTELISLAIIFFELFIRWAYFTSYYFASQESLLILLNSFTVRFELDYGSIFKAAFLKFYSVTYWADKIYLF